MRFLIILSLTVALVHAAVSPGEINHVRDLLHVHKLGAAESAANALMTANPAEAEVYVLLSEVYVAKGDPDGAVKAGEKAVALAPANSGYRHRLGDTYGFAAQKASVFGMMGWAKKCRLAYEKAVELDPANLEARHSLLDFCLQAPGLMGGGVDKAHVQAAAIKQLDSVQGYFAYGRVYTSEKKYAEALTEFDEYLKTSPDDYAALYQLGKIAANSGQWLDRGLLSLRRCLALTPPAGVDVPSHAAAHWRIGNILEKKNDPAGARAAYEAALRLEPNFTQAAEALKNLI